MEAHKAKRAAKKAAAGDDTKDASATDAEKAAWKEAR